MHGTFRAYLQLDHKYARKVRHKGHLAAECVVASRYSSSISAMACSSDMARPSIQAASGPASASSSCRGNSIAPSSLS